MFFIPVRHRPDFIGRILFASEVIIATALSVGFGFKSLVVWVAASAVVILVLLTQYLCRVASVGPYATGDTARH